MSEYERPNRWRKIDGERWAAGSASETDLCHIPWMMRTVPVGAALLLAAVMALPACNSTAEKAASSPDQPAKTWLVTVEGMTCAENCAPVVAAALESMQGVSDVDLDFATKTARVTTSLDTELTAEACDQAFQDSGKNEGYFVSEIHTAQE